MLKGKHRMESVKLRQILRSQVYIIARMREK